MQGTGFSMFCPLVRLHSKIRYADMLNDPLVDHVWMNDVKICQVQQDEQDEQDDVDHAWSWSIYVNVFILFLFNVTRPPILTSHCLTAPPSLAACAPAWCWTTCNADFGIPRSKKVTTCHTIPQKSSAQDIQNPSKLGWNFMRKPSWLVGTFPSTALISSMSASAVSGFNEENLRAKSKLWDHIQHPTSIH